MNLPKRYALLERFKGKEYLIEELSITQINELNKVHEILFEISYNASRRKIIDLNINDYIEKTELYRQKLSAKKPEYEDEFSEIYDIITDINRLFINILSSFISYVEFIEKNLGKIYSINSEELRRFKSVTNKLYDNCFAYRFFYHLRNFSIHYGFPIRSLKTKFSNIKENGSNDLEFNICFEKSKLLQDPTIKKKIEYDLRSYNDFFPVNPFFPKILICAEELERTLFQIRYNTYLEARNRLYDYYNRAKIKQLVYYGEYIDKANITRELQHKLLRIDLIKKFDSVKLNST